MGKIACFPRRRARLRRGFGVAGSAVATALFAFGLSLARGPKLADSLFHGQKASLVRAALVDAGSDGRVARAGGYLCRS